MIIKLQTSTINTNDIVYVGQPKVDCGNWYIPVILRSHSALQKLPYGQCPTDSAEKRKEFFDMLHEQYQFISNAMEQDGMRPPR